MYFVHVDVGAANTDLDELALIDEYLKVVAVPGGEDHAAQCGFEAGTLLDCAGEKTVIEGELDTGSLGVPGEGGCVAVGLRA